MSKVDQATLTEFGTLVLRQSSLRGWTLDQLAAAMDGACGKSMLSKITKGKRDTISPRIVGKLIKALDLDESWIDRFISPGQEMGDETQAEKDADRVMSRLGRDGQTEGVPEELLIRLANSYAEGKYRDWQSAYIAVKLALDAYENMRADRVVSGNADTQFAAVMQEVERLNAKADFDAAGDELDDIAKRHDQVGNLIFEQQLAQDRLRNRPDLAAKRLIKNLRQKDHPGGLFNALAELADQRLYEADQQGDIFGLRVAKEIAKDTYERFKSKKPLKARALHLLGWCHLRLAERATTLRHHEIAHDAFTQALKLTSKTSSPLESAHYAYGLGAVLAEYGARKAEPASLQRSILHTRTALEVVLKTAAPQVKDYYNTLGNALSKLGEITQDPTPLQEAEEVLRAALELQDKTNDLANWAVTQSNLALAQRWLGAITQDASKLSDARQGFAAADSPKVKDVAPFLWAIVQWNIADLALARFELDQDSAHLIEANAYVARAREVFVEGSDYQTQRCDDLLERINAAA